MARVVRFYRSSSGQCPVEEFLDSLTGRQAQKVIWVLKLIEGMDMVPTRYFKKLVDTDGLWEARVDFGGDAFRLLAFFDGGQIVVLAHGFRKKTQRIPLNLISLAEERKRDYFRRKVSLEDKR